MSLSSADFLKFSSIFSLRVNICIQKITDKANEIAVLAQEPGKAVVKASIGGVFQREGAHGTNHSNRVTCGALKMRIQMLRSARYQETCSQALDKLTKEKTRGVGRKHSMDCLGLEVPVALQVEVRGCTLRLFQTSFSSRPRRGVELPLTHNHLGSRSCKAAADL